MVLRCSGLCEPLEPILLRPKLVIGIESDVLQPPSHPWDARMLCSHMGVLPLKPPA